MHSKALPASSRQWRRAPLPARSTLHILGDGLSADRERELAARIKLGDLEARNELVEANLALARSWASRWADARRRSLELDDLYHEAVGGLIEAANRYDPVKHNTRFTTYASYWVQQRIRRAVRYQDELIRIPEHIHLAGEAAKYRLGQRDFMPKIHDRAADDPAIPDEVVLRDQRDRLRAAYWQLKPDQRELLVGFAVEQEQRGANSPSERLARDNRNRRAKKLLATLRRTLNPEGTDDGC